MKSFETPQQPAENFLRPEGDHLEVTNAAQMELMELMGGVEQAGAWIEANAARFRELVSDPDRDLVERLANEDTHVEAIEEIKNNLYH